MAKSASTFDHLQNDIQRNFDADADLMPTGIYAQYKEPENFDLKAFRNGAATYFKRIVDIFDDDWQKVCSNIDNVSRLDVPENVWSLPETSGRQEIKLKTSDVKCVQIISVSKDLYGASLTFQYLKNAQNNFGIQLIYALNTRMLYVSTSATDSESESRYAVEQVLMPLLWQSENGQKLTPDSIDGISAPIFLPGDLSEKDAKAELDRILNSDFESLLPYAFFTKMLGFAYPFRNLSLGCDRDEITNHLIALRGVAHPVLIETRDLAVYVTSILRRKKIDMRLPSADSGFALITWPNCADAAALVRPEDCVDEKGNNVVPLEVQVAHDAIRLVSLKNACRQHLTMSDAVKAEKAETEEREKAIRESDLYKALAAENEKLKAELKNKKPANDSHKQKGLEDKCEELRVANGQLKLRIDALEAKTKALREKKAAASDFTLHTDGIHEMYDNEIYLQIMALLSDALPNLRTAGATRRMEIVQALLKANNYDDQMDKIHSSIVAAARTGRKEDLYSVLAEYNIAVDDKEHPAFHFNGDSAAIDNMSGTPSDVHSNINAAKHIGKTFF